MARGRIRAKIRRSSLYTFGQQRSRPAYRKDQGPLQEHQGPGYSRVIYCNQPRLHQKRLPLKYCSNYISTTKYNVLTFLPVALFEQFRRVANIYFLLAAFLSLTPVSPFSAISQIAPLAFVVGLSMAKELYEDLQRFVQDMKVNFRKASVHVENGIFEHKPWRKIAVGDIVRVEKDQFFPADLMLLLSSYDDGICYVETMNLDGETNLKVKRALESFSSPSPSEGDDEDESTFFRDFEATIRCESPNPKLYTFVGNFVWPSGLSS